MAAEGSEEPKREVKRSPEEKLPPIVGTTAAQSPALYPDLTFASRWGRWFLAPVAAADPMPEYLENLARERLVWGVAVAVSWTVAVVALLRLAGVIL